MKVVISEKYSFGLSRAAFLKLRAQNWPPALEELDWGESMPDDPDDESLQEMKALGIPLYIHEKMSFEIKGSFFVGLDHKYRNDPVLIKVIEDMGHEAYRDGGRLKILDIPDDIEWEVHENEFGSEWIAEKHRIWF